MAVISSNHNQPSLLARHMPPLTCYNYVVITERHPSKFLAPSSRVKLLRLSRIKLIQMRHIGHFGLTASLYSAERCPLQFSICQIVGKTNYTMYITSGAKAYRERQCVCVWATFSPFAKRRRKGRMFPLQQFVVALHTVLNSGI